MVGFSVDTVDMVPTSLLKADMVRREGLRANRQLREQFAGLVLNFIGVCACAGGACLYGTRRNDPLGAVLLRRCWAFLPCCRGRRAWTAKCWG